MGASLLERDAEPVEELLVEVDVCRLLDVAQLAGEVARDGAEDRRDRGRWARSASHAAMFGVAAAV